MVDKQQRCYLSFQGWWEGGGMQLPRGDHLHVRALPSRSSLSASSG